MFLRQDSIFFFFRVGALPVLGPSHVSVSLRTILSVSVNMLVVVWVGSELDTRDQLGSKWPLLNTGQLP